MALYPSQIERSERLLKQAADWGVADPTPPTSLTQRLSTSFRTSNDDRLAEELLKRRRLNADDGNHRSRSGLRRALTTTKKKNWNSNEIFDALDAHVTNNGSPGVAEALVFKLLSAGAPLSATSTKRASILGRIRSRDSVSPRNSILRKAVESRQTDMVALLVQHADHHSLDLSLPVALLSGDAVIVELLLQHGANIWQTLEGQEAFQQICSAGGRGDLVQLIIAADGRPSQGRISDCLVSAVKRGCLNTVLCLSRSSADGNHRDAAALKEAVSQCRVDIALAILTGTHPPSGNGVNGALEDVFNNMSIIPNEKLALTQALLCAGASGDAVSAALIQACEVEFFEMADLLVSYGASVEYQDAVVLRKAIAKGQSALVGLLLTERTTLSRIYASECVETIPKHILPEDRHVMLSALLRKGAGGSALDEALIDAVKAGDVQSTELLLTPHFPGGLPVSDGKISRGVIYDRHETASVDYRDGEALRIAVMTSNSHMVQQLINNKPSPQTIAFIFPQVLNLSPADRYQMAELFLATGLTGPCVSAALGAAVTAKPPQRDEHFIDLLLRYNADVNFNSGATILSAIAQEDVDLLERLVKNRLGPQTVAAGLSRSIQIVDRPRRYRAVSLLIEAGAGIETTNCVSDALVSLLQASPVDTKLMSLLFGPGKADANFNHGLPIVHAIHHPNPAALDCVLRKGHPSSETAVRGLNALSELPSSQAKATKLEMMLRATKHQQTLDSMLVKEVQMLIDLSAEQRILTVLKLLVSAGADVNAQMGTALRSAMLKADTPICDVLLAAHPNPTTLASSLPYALRISDSMDRLTFTRKLLEAGAPSNEANRALVHAVKRYPDDISLIHDLATHADSSDGEALTAAIRQEQETTVELLLGAEFKPYSVGTLNFNFLVAMTKVVDKVKRAQICTLLLTAGASGPCISDALITAAADGDTALGAALLAKGDAKIEHQGGRAVVEACRGGSPEVLVMLLGTKTEITKTTLARGFQAATEIGDLKKRAEVFRLLLDKGVSGEVVDAQLVSAARFGQDGRALVKLLLEHGADVNYNNGEAVWTAARSAILGSLALMLGVTDAADRQSKPTRITISKALKASWMLSKDPRYQVIEWVFQAGYSLSEEQMHTTLIKAVKKEPDLRLIRLLLANGASPLANGCQCLTDTIQGLVLDVLTVFLERDVPQQDLDWSFKQAFTEAAAEVWLSEDGYEAAKMLLEKGARGDGVTAALSLAIDAYGSGKDEIARKFVKQLTHVNIDVDHDGGIVIQKAARRAESQLIQQLLTRGPNARAVSMAFPYIFDADVNEEQLLQLISLFTEYHKGEERLDVTLAHPEHKPVLFKAVSRFPRSVKILQALLDAGFYHDQMIMDRIMPEYTEEEEQVTLLLWALLQPQKLVSDSVVELLIQRGAKLNFQTRLSKTTPLMLAVQSKRKDIVRSILLAGVDVDVADVVDATGNTPLTMATRIGGEVGTTMMADILAADPFKDDGSLHNAARDLNLRAVQTLVKFGHELDFPSPIHDGRSALGELCLHAASRGPLTAEQEKSMEKIMAYLLENGSDPAVQSYGKSVLLLALESADPLPTTRILLKVGLWKHVTAEFNNYTDGRYVYSATQYVLRVLPQTDTIEALLALLRYRADTKHDVYYALSGPQPEDALNVPEDIMRAEQVRRDRLDRIEADAEDHQLAVARTKELAGLEDGIFAQRTQRELAKSRGELNVLRERGAIEEESFTRRLNHKKAEHGANLQYEADLAAAGVRRLKVLGDAEVDVQNKKQLAALTYEMEYGNERLSNAKKLSTVRVQEQKEIDRLEQINNTRIRGRIEQQKAYVETQDRLASRLLAGGINQRQIGYITGEVGG